MTYPAMQPPPRRVKLSIDRIQVEFRTAHRTQAWRLQKGLGATFVEGLTDAGTEVPPDQKNTPCALFRATIQDPTHHATLRASLDSIGAQDCRLVLLEVALDVFIPGATRHTLAEVTADLYRRVTAPPASHWHLYKISGRGSEPVGKGELTDRRTLVRRLADGHQLADVFKGTHPAVRHHLYVKSTNDGRALAPMDWSARHEITLTGAGLDGLSLAEIGLMRFADHLRYRKLSSSLSPFIVQALDWSVTQYGRRGRYARQHPTRAGVFSGEPTHFRRFTDADTQLYDTVRDELRRLDRRWKAPKAQRPTPRTDQNFRAETHAETTGDEQQKSPVHAASSRFPPCGQDAASNYLDTGECERMEIEKQMQLDEEEGT